MSTALRLAPLLALLMLLTACVGIEGPPGRDGRDGVDGTFAISIPFIFDLDIDTRAGAVASAAFDMPEITPSVTDNGVVIVYFFDQGTWTALPFTIGLESPEEPVVDYTVTLGYAFDDALLEVFLEASTDDDIVWEEIDAFFGGGVDMRAVILDGVVAGQTTVDLTDYDAVVNHFNLDA